MTEGFAGLPYHHQATTTTVRPASKAMVDLLRKHAREVAALAARERRAAREMDSTEDAE